MLPQYLLGAALLLLLAFNWRRAGSTAAQMKDDGLRAYARQMATNHASRFSGAHSGDPLARRWWAIAVPATLAVAAAVIWLRAPLGEAVSAMRRGAAPQVWQGVALYGAALLAVVAAFGFFLVGVGTTVDRRGIRRPWWAGGTEITWETVTATRYRRAGGFSFIDIKIGWHRIRFTLETFEDPDAFLGLLGLRLPDEAFES